MSVAPASSTSGIRQSAAGELNSISQQWYSAGPEATVQTVECGWQANPFRYGNTIPVLFVFWTPDGYSTPATI
jgi:hypothetical protein